MNNEAVVIKMRTNFDIMLRDLVDREVELAKVSRITIDVRKSLYTIETRYEFELIKDTLVLRV